MSNANRDYAIVYDVKNSSLTLSRPLIFYITDKNTSNIFVRLVTRVSVGNGIDQYTDIEEASDYVLTMKVIKPNNEVKSIEATQHEPGSIFQFDLTEDFKDIPGKYICELTISTIVSERQELITSDPFSYEVKRSILSNVGEIIETEDTTVEKLLNNLEASKTRLFNDLELAKTNLHNDLNATSSALNSQVQDNNNKIENIKEELNLQVQASNDKIDNINGELSSQIKEITDGIFYINICEFGAKGDGVTDNTNAFNKAFEFAFENSMSVIIPKGEYVITNTLNCSPTIHIIPYGEVIIKDKGTNSVTISMQSLDEETASSDSFFTSPNISNSFGNIILINDTKNVKTGIYTTGRTKEDTRKRNNLVLQGITFKKYNKGLHINSYSTYIMTYEKLVFTGCDYGLYIGNDEGITVDSGEKIVFNDCVWGNCKTAIINKSIKLELTFNYCSIDMCGSCVIGGKAIKLDFNDCHFEAFGIGANYVETNTDFEGIVKVDDSTNDYDRTFVTLNDCIIVCGGTPNNSSQDIYRYPSTQFFVGSRMMLYLNNIIFDYNEKYWFENTILPTGGTFSRIFCVDYNVKKVSVNNVSSLYNCKPHIISKYNKIKYGCFEGDTPKSFTISNKKVVNGTLNEFEINDSLNVHSVDLVNDADLGRNCLKIQCDYTNTSSYVEMTSKKYYPIMGNNFDGLIMLKGYKYKHWSNLGMNSLCYIFIDFYDEDNTLLSSPRLYNSYRVYHGDDADEQTNVSNSDKWMISHINRNDLFSIPSNAVKYKIRVKMFANFGDDIYTPVYFTGISVFNY